MLSFAQCKVLFISYLRWTVHLLPFLFSLLCPFFFGRPSLQTKREYQEKDDELLNAHSGVCRACGGENKQFKERKPLNLNYWGLMVCNLITQNDLFSHHTQQILTFICTCDRRQQLLNMYLWWEYKASECFIYFPWMLCLCPFPDMMHSHFSACMSHMVNVWNVK